MVRRDMLEEIMDDEDEVRDINLSSRPLREERRRARERERLERGIARTHDQHGPSAATSRASSTDNSAKSRPAIEDSR